MSRFVIDERRFRELVAGKTIAFHRGDVEIALADIGWARMIAAVLNAMELAERPPGDPPQAGEFVTRGFLSRRSRRIT